MVKKSSLKEGSIARVTFEAPSTLKTAFKVKVTSEQKDMKDVLCGLMQAYIDNKVKFKLH